MNDILIWGAGAIGGTVGAVLKRLGHDVTFVDQVADHVLAINDPAKGLHIAGPVEDFKIHGGAFLPGDLTGQWRRIFLAVKGQHTVAACEALKPHLADDGFVLSLQNGLCERHIAEVVGASRTVGAFINFGADWIGPGEILYGNRGAVVVGEIDGVTRDRTRALFKDIQGFEPDAILTDDIASYLWGKLGYVSLLFAQAVGQLGIADCLAREPLLPLWRALAGEAMRVAAAEGVDPKGFNGFDPAAFAAGATEGAARASVAAMVAFNRPNAKTHSGIWRDLAVRRRTTEVDMQMGLIARIGRQHGVPCPALEALTAMIHEIENGTRRLDDANLDILLKQSGYA